MNFEIKRDRWTEFLDTLSKRRFEWTARVEVLSGAMGDQVLTEGLPLNGITVETTDGRTSITISVGENVEFHQTHSIKNPTRVAFLDSEDDYRDVIDIEEEDGTKTLITFIKPRSVTAGFTEVDMAVAAA